eukprot:gene8952-biopygen12174
MAQEQQGEVTWEQSNLTRGKERRYKPVDPAAIRWLPYTGQRRGVMYPEEPGQFGKECHMYHEDAGKEKGGVVQTGIATGVEITEGRIKVWTCPQPSTTQEGEATHLPITLRHIVQQEEKGECGQDTTHVITVDSGSTLANWIAACDERDKQAWERQLSTFAVETRRWAKQIKGKVVVVKQSSHSVSPGNLTIDQEGHRQVRQNIRAWRTGPGRISVAAVRTVQGEKEPQPKPINYRFGQAMREQVQLQHLEDWSHHEGGILARLELERIDRVQQEREGKGRSAIQAKGLAKGKEASENTRLKGSQVYWTQKFAAARAMDLTTWKRLRRNRAKALHQNIDDCKACHTPGKKDDVNHWFLHCAGTERTRRLVWKKMENAMGPGIHQLGDEEWI